MNDTNRIVQALQKLNKHHIRIPVQMCFQTIIDLYQWHLLL